MEALSSRVLSVYITSPQSIWCKGDVITNVSEHCHAINSYPFAIIIEHDLWRDPKLRRSPGSDIMQNMDVDPLMLICFRI